MSMAKWLKALETRLAKWLVGPPGPSCDNCGLASSLGWFPTYLRTVEGPLVPVTVCWFCKHHTNIAHDTRFKPLWEVHCGTPAT